MVLYQDHYTDPPGHKFTHEQNSQRERRGPWGLLKSSNAACFADRKGSTPNTWLNEARFSLSLSYLQKATAHNATRMHSMWKRSSEEAFLPFVTADGGWLRQPSSLQEANNGGDITWFLLKGIIQAQRWSEMYKCPSLSCYLELSRKVNSLQFLYHVIKNRRQKTKY